MQHRRAKQDCSGNCQWAPKAQAASECIDATNARVVTSKQSKYGRCNKLRVREVLNSLSIDKRIEEWDERSHIPFFHSLVDVDLTMEVQICLQPHFCNCGLRNLRKNPFSKISPSFETLTKTTIFSNNVCSSNGWEVLHRASPFPPALHGNKKGRVARSTCLAVRVPARKI